MDSYIINITLIGLAALGMAWMPVISKKINISYALIYVVAGIALYALFSNLRTPNPIWHPEVTLHISELVVIISLMGTGLKIDQPFSFKTWAVPFRLITVTMILCIGLVTVIAHYFFNFDIASSLLLGAVLAPTDPVLASDVQVGPPMEKTKDNVRFSLTAEAGMNDGMAFPFVWLAIAFAISATNHTDTIHNWFWMDVVYKIIAGIACGYGLGRLLAYLIFYLPDNKNIKVIRDGFIAVSATLLVYGITELVKGYGFFAVFVTAVTLRNYELDHKFHKKLHDFTDQVERILIAVVLLLFGGTIASGILKHLNWQLMVFSLVFVLVIRPLTGMIGLIGTNLHIKEKTAISFFGIRGIGSFFYLAFAIQHAYFKNNEALWSIVSFIVLLSCVVHGITATTVMKKLEDEFAQLEEVIEEEKGFENKKA